MMGNKKIEYFFVLMLGVGCASLIHTESQVRTPQTQLQKTQLHTCECWAAGDDNCLEVGKIVLCFSENPMVHPLPSTVYTAKNEHIFFIPTADVSAEQLRAMMEAVKKNSNKWYSVKLSLEKKPIPGIKVVLTYDPGTVSMEQTSFDTLGTQKGVVFRLYNKSMINALKLRERSLLRITQLRPFTVTV